MQKANPIYLFIPILLVAGILFASDYNGLKDSYVAIFEKGRVGTIEHEAYDKVMDVLTHPRCINCHPNDDIPKQGDDSHPHFFGMSRGDGSHGFEATKCTTCHQVENNAYSGVPGAPEWALAPDKMKWEGLTRAEIARSMLNKANTGNRNHIELIKHLTAHELVLWAWDPGVDAEGIEREKPPVALEEYKRAVYEWFENGAVIPEE